MKRIGLSLVVLIVLFLGILFFWSDILNFYLSFSSKLPEIEKGIRNSVAQEIKEQISTPPPLQIEKESAQSSLTRDGVINWTNNQRSKNGLPQLTENTKLNLSAEIKAQDMFTKQYFAHESPQGTGVGDLAEEVNYSFIAIGENQALGNFENDEILVQAWMDSPGHRANILNSKYREIGVSVIKGTYEGRTTWMAVQHFGMPLSACPRADESLKAKIESKEKEIQLLELAMENLQTDIQSIKPRSRSAYNQKIEQYNSLVEQYNSLVESTKNLINIYNAQVNAFNECANAQ